MNIKPLLPHSDVILYLGQDDKASVHVGRSVPLSDVTQQSTGAIVGQYQIFITAYHDWNYERVIPSAWISLKHMANLSTVVGPMEFAVFLSLSIMQPLMVQLKSNIL